jgi:hypothetical protein
MTTDQNCVACPRDDDFQDMVECERCMQWRHYICAGIKNVIEGQPIRFVCPKCQIDTLAEKLDKLTTTFSSIGEGMQHMLGALSAQRESSQATNDTRTIKSNLISNNSEGISLQKNNSAGEGTSQTQLRSSQSTISTGPEAQCTSELMTDQVTAIDARNVTRIENISSPLEKMLTRQSLQELPTFDGNPLDWPKFKTIYEQTTTAGSFSAVENLVRLEKSLKGEALNMTRALFFDPNNIRDIIRTLEFHYGQPQKVINALTKDLLRLKPPKDGPIHNLVTFAQKLRNLVCSIKSVNMNQYLFQPMLVKELTERLSLPLQYKWGEYYLRNQDSNLDQFSEWVFEQATIASLVVKDTVRKESYSF